jgi:hypothetical protein
MDGKQQRRVSALKTIGIVLLLFSALALATDEPLDLEFLEWLGQMTEVEDFGVDIEQLLLSKEQASEGDDAESTTQ